MDQSCYRFGTWFGGDLGFFLFTKLDINDMRRILLESKNEISYVHFIYESICLTPRPF